MFVMNNTIKTNGFLLCMPPEAREWLGNPYESRLTFRLPDAENQVIVHSSMQLHIELPKSLMHLAPPEHSLRVEVEALMDEMPETEVEGIINRYDFIFIVDLPPVPKNDASLAVNLKHLYRTDKCARKIQIVRVQPTEDIPRGL